MITEELFFVLNNFIQLRQMESCSFTKNKQMTTPSPYILIVFLEIEFYKLCVGAQCALSSALSMITEEHMIFFLLIFA